ncbi:MAG: DUF3141 domain-containing protein, partial [Sulfuritalea sp.]|nr:DUF3141 domain-containing protein [Sulfuritalea sp.]
MARCGAAARPSSYAVHESIGHLGIFVAVRNGTEGHRGVRLQHGPDRRAAARPLRGAVMTENRRQWPIRTRSPAGWIVRFEPRTLDDVRAIVQPAKTSAVSPAAKRVSEINLGMYRTLFQPFVRAFINEQTSNGCKAPTPPNCPTRSFPRAQPADATACPTRRAGARAAPAGFARQSSRAVAAIVSDAIIAALDGYRDLRDWLHGADLPGD